MMVSSPTGLVDFHCHLDLYPDFESAVEQRERDGLFTLTVTTTPKAWPHNRDITEATRHVRSALGLHPQLVDKYSHEISLWKEYLPQTRYIGEVGLDAGPRFYKSFEKQKEVFAQILSACALSGGKILSIHSVRSSKIVLDMIESRLPSTRGRVVLHWFTGTPSEAKKAVELGCYFSINPTMLNKNRGRKLVQSLPIVRVLTETDGPFTGEIIAQDGTTAVLNTVAGMAQLFGKEEEEMRTAVIANLRSLLQ